MSALLVRMWREAEGLTQAEAAERWGVTRQSWNRYERGKRKPPRPLVKWIEARVAKPPTPE